MNDLNDDSIDMILCTEVLEHVPEPIKAVKEMSRLLKPGGYAFLSMPFGGALHNLPYHYQAGLTHVWFQKQAEDFGFEIIYAYAFESLTNRLRRLLANGQCMEEIYGARGRENLDDLLTKTLPPILEELRQCPQTREYAADGAFPVATRVV